MAATTVDPLGEDATSQEAAGQEAGAPLSEQTIEASTGFVGRWQTLVSTTNWEKGRIICEWRTALEESEAPVTEYSDEAWAQMVGEVTGQHVGRLRRTFDRFGSAAGDYEGLYWSHFQTALDWNDAEMWLEGALQNKWSVAQMRAQRWEAVEGKDQPEGAPTQPPAGSAPQGDEDAVAVDSPVRESTDEDAERSESDSSGAGSTSDEDYSPEMAPSVERQQPVRPMKDLAELPEDLAEAFEQFKLAILTHKMTGWEEVSREDVLASLSALEQLAMAPSGE